MVSSDHEVIMADDDEIHSANSSQETPNSDSEAVIPETESTV